MAEASTKSPKTSPRAQARRPKPLAVVRDEAARKREVREAILTTLS